MSTPEDLAALLTYHPSPHNGLTLCQGCVSEMCGGTGRTVPDVIRSLPRGRVHFVHFRDVVGCAGSFVETFQVRASPCVARFLLLQSQCGLPVPVPWQDDGQTDMLEALRAWQGYGFVGPVRPDHVPLLEGEEGHATGEKAVVRRLARMGYTSLVSSLRFCLHGGGSRRGTFQARRPATPCKGESGPLPT